jgi:hypothetical protein
VACRAGSGACAAACAEPPRYGFNVLWKLPLNATAGISVCAVCLVFLQSIRAAARPDPQRAIDGTPTSRSPRRHSREPGPPHDTRHRRVRCISICPAHVAARAVHFIHSLFADTSHTSAPTRADSYTSPSCKPRASSSHAMANGMPDMPTPTHHMRSVYGWLCAVSPHTTQPPLRTLHAVPMAPPIIH